MTRWFFLKLLAGFTLWAAAFLLLYGVQAAGCHLGWDAVPFAGPVTVLRALLIAGFLLFLAALAWQLRAFAARGGRSFGRDAVVFATAGAGFSFLFTFAGVFWLSLC